MMVDEGCGARDQPGEIAMKKNKAGERANAQSISATARVLKELFGM